MRTDFQISCEPPLARLRLSGELDLMTADRLQDLLDQTDVAGCTHVEVDLEGVTFIDARSLGLLDRHQRRLASAGGGLVVVAASPCHVRVSELAGYENLHPGPGIRRRLTLVRDRPLSSEGV